MSKAKKKSKPERAVDMSKFNQGDLFALDAFDTTCLGCGIGHDKAKFRFCMGEISHLRNEELCCLFEDKDDYVIVDLYLYGIKDVRIKFDSSIKINDSDVVDFDEVDGRLRVALLEEHGGLIEFQLGYASYKWEYVKEYPPDDDTEEEDAISGDEYKTLVWDD